jgi:methylmalonyl-CoA mutase
MLTSRQSGAHVPDDLPSLGEPADEADWRALVEKGLRGASWARLTSTTSDGVPIAPLYREPDCPSATDVSGFPGAAPFIRGARQGAWTIRQSFAHPSPEQTNHDILADLQGGVSGIELKIDPTGADGVAIKNAGDLDLALTDVILEAAPVSLDAGAHGLCAAELLEAKLKGVAAAGTAFNIDPLGALMREGGVGEGEIAAAARFAARVCDAMPAAAALRVDARPVHEAGGTEAQEIATALACGIAYMRALQNAGLNATDAARSLLFTLSVGPDVLVEAAKLRALRLCWAYAAEAFGAEADAPAARIHAVTSRRMMTRYDAQTNILRVTVAAFAAAIGGADAITTLPFTDALGLPTPFARRVARNTQHVLLEESHLGHVADPAGGAWFVEKLTRDLAAKAWEIMQLIETRGGIVAALQAGLVQSLVAEARVVRQHAIATRRETITGVTDFPLLGAAPPAFETASSPHSHASRGSSSESGGACRCDALVPIRWAAPFEKLRDKAERQRARVFSANLGPMAEFSTRALWAQNLFAAGGISAIGAEEAHISLEAMIAAFSASGASAALIAGADPAYSAHAGEAARALKGAGAIWVVLAGKPGDHEAAWREAGVDQFVHAGQDALNELETVHAALGIA